MNSQALKIGVVVLIAAFLTLASVVWAQQSGIISFYEPIAVSTSDNSATFTWSTVNHSTAVIDYGITTSYGQSIYDNDMSRAFSGTISGLSSA